MQRACKHIGLGALIGLGVGVLVAALLLYGGFRAENRDEGWEATALLAYVASWPTGGLFVWLWGGLPAEQWRLFVAVAPSLNGLVIGTLTGLFTFLVSELFRASPAPRAS
jgi:hypothetical protein